MNRALVNAPYTLEATLFSGATPTDPAPDDATVEVVRADGTVVIAAGAATNNTGTGTFARTLTSAQMALLDTLEARWTMTVGSETTTLRTHVEVVGGFLCTLADLAEEFSQGSSESDADYAARLTRIRTAAEQRLESECRQAFVPRYALETSRMARKRLRLNRSPVRLIRSLSVDGTAYGQSTIDAVTWGAGGSVYLVPWASSRWYGATTVGYEFGHDFPDERVREAVVAVARETFSDSTDGRVVRREADGQAVTYASPSSSGGFLDPGLRSLVRDLQRSLVA
jgi:hypothetical protein